MEGRRSSFPPVLPGDLHFSPETITADGVGPFLSASRSTWHKPLMKRGASIAVGVVVLLGLLAALWQQRAPTTSPPLPVVAGVDPNAAVLTAEPVALGFPGATDWRAEPSCTDVAAADPCVSQWRHTTGQVARVLLLPVPDPARLPQLAARLQEQTKASGGVAEDITTAGGQQVIRLLQPMRDADHADATLVGFTYVLTAPDHRTLHMVTSSAPLKDEAEADRRLQDLLAFGAWVDARH